MLMMNTSRILMMPPTDGGGGEAGAGAGDAGAGDAAAAAAAAAAAGGAGGEGGEAAPWYSELPDDLKASQLVLRSKTLVDALTAGNAAEKRLGVPANELIRLPTKPEDVEGLKAVYKALGAPDTPDGYKIDWEGSTDEDKAVVGEFAKFMHEKGPFPPAALAAAAEFWRGKISAEDEAFAKADEAAKATTEAALRAEWGAAYDQRKTEIGKLITEIGGEDVAKELNADSVLGNSPALAKMLAKIVDMRAEGGPSGDGQTAVVGDRKMTPGQARVNLAALEGDERKSKALFDAEDPMHAAVVEERNKLLAMANPQPVKA
jgi:hypothetical protein